MTSSRIVLKQVGIVLLGLVAAGIMVGLGLWQLGVYNSQGTRVTQARAAEAPVPLLSAARPGQPVGDVYGRQVETTGRYDAGLQLLVPDQDEPGQERVLTALRFADGGAVPVVRGLVPTGSEPPAPPSGEVEVVGVFLPSEPDPRRNPSLGGSLAAIELPLLAQRWSPTLSNGFITLPASAAAAQGLAPAEVSLPEGQGRTQNAAYAFQWWIFALFALVMAGRMARDIGRRADYEYLGEQEAPGSGPDEGDGPGGEVDPTGNPTGTVTGTAKGTATGGPVDGATELTDERVDDREPARHG